MEIIVFFFELIKFVFLCTIPLLLLVLLWIIAILIFYIIPACIQQWFICNSKRFKKFKEKLICFEKELLENTKAIYLNNIVVENKISNLKKIIKGNEEFIENEKIFTENEKIQKHAPEAINFYEKPKAWVIASNKLFIEKEKVDFKEFFETIEDNPLTEEQQEAVISNENNNLVVAGAGSGKTSVIVARVGYLIDKRYATPDEILVLTFNKKATEEIKNRIKDKLSCEFENIKTFHSFGMSVIQEVNTEPNICEWADDNKKFSEKLNNIIENSHDKKKILTYFKEYLIPYKKQCEFETEGDYIDYIRNYEIRTLNNEKVKSYEECEIANFLRLHNINYKYEKSYKYKTSTSKKRQYKPDFYLPDYDIYIEHFGISRTRETAPYIDNEKYLEDIEWKIALHKEKGTTLIQTFSYEKSEGNLCKNLKEKLEEKEVLMEEVPFLEALKIFKEKNNYISKFTKLVSSFLSHYRNNELNIKDILKQVATNDLRTKTFLSIFNDIYKTLEKEKKDKKCIDFDDMIIQAIDLIKLKKYESKFKYILIDEFQDISSSRAKLIKALKSQNEAIITAVGDDWQSINRFAGSDISIIKNFEKHFGITKTTFLNNTFRFDNHISKVSSQFIMKNESQISKEIKTFKNVNKPSIYIYEKLNDDNDMKNVDEIKAILEILKRNLKISACVKKEIGILTRFNRTKKKLEKNSSWKYIKQEYSMFNIELMTVHASKGLGFDYAILLDLDIGEFPCAKEDDALLNFVMPFKENYLYSEERRLFYVALTRAKKKIFIISDPYNQSSFVKEIVKDNIKNEIFKIKNKNATSKIKDCPECKRGSIIKKENKKDGTFFYSCSNYPYCDYKEAILECELCGKDLIKRDFIAFECSNENCPETVELCQKCNEYMEVKKGKNGSFLGCSNFKKTKCNFTIDIE